MVIYTLESEDNEIVRIDSEGRKETMVKGSGGHKWRNINGKIQEED